MGLRDSSRTCLCSTVHFRSRRQYFGVGEEDLILLASRCPPHVFPGWRGSGSWAHLHLPIHLPMSAARADGRKRCAAWILGLQLLCSHEGGLAGQGRLWLSERATGMESVAHRQDLIGSLTPCMVNQKILRDWPAGHECWLLCCNDERSFCPRLVAKKTEARRLASRKWWWEKETCSLLTPGLALSLCVLDGTDLGFDK